MDLPADPRRQAFYGKTEGDIALEDLPLGERKEHDGRHQEFGKFQGAQDPPVKKLPQQDIPDRQKGHEQQQPDGTPVQER